MRYLFFLPLLLLFSYHCVAQKVYLIESVDTAPVIEGCHDSKDTKDCFNERLHHHILTTLNVQRTYHSAGKAYVQFKISADGQVQEVKVRAMDDKHREEAKRVIEMLKVQSPATLNGQKVAVVHALPISFRTKRFDSREEYRRSEDFEKTLKNKISKQDEAAPEIVAFEALQFPPEYEQCKNIVNKKECFGRMTEIKLRMLLKNENPQLKSGTEIKYFFQIDREGETSQVMVNAPGSLTSRIVRDFLQELSFGSPAKNKKGEPVKTEFLGKLIL